MAAITTPPIRVSFPTIFTPRAIEQGQTPKYSIVLMFDKTNADHLAALKALFTEAQAAFNAKWPANADGTPNAKAPRIPLKGHDKSPFKDGDTACNSQGIPLSEKNPEYAGHFVVRAASTTKPLVVDRATQEVLDSAAVYGGCWCKVNLNPYAYDTAGNKGVTFGLNGVQFWKEGDSFGGGRPALSDMFTKAESENPAAYGNTAADPFAAAPAAAPAAPAASAEAWD
jgi:hypothetical protein